MQKSLIKKYLLIITTSLVLALTTSDIFASPHWHCWTDSTGLHCGL